MIQRAGLGLLLVWIVLGPVLRQGFGVNQPFLPAWHMYRGWGSNIVVLELHRNHNGELHRLDRLAILGFPDGAPREVRTLKTPADLERQVRQLCRVLPPNTDLRVTAKVGRRHGWKVLRTGRENACR